MTRVSTVFSAVSISALITATTVGGMAVFSSKYSTPKQDSLIAEPVPAPLPEPAAPRFDPVTLASIDVTRDSKLTIVPAAATLDISDRWVRQSVELAEEGDVPLPRRRPEFDVKLASTTIALGALSMSDAVVFPSLPATKNFGNWPKDKVFAAREKCEKLLRGLDLKFKAKDPIGAPGGCGIAYPLSVTSIAGVEITPAATINCQMAAALHGWITNVVQPSANKQFETRLTGLQNASSYACRRRNNASTGKLSEHGFGNALDIADFRFSNRVEASVAGGWSGSIKGLSLASRGNFMKVARKGACKYFNTVLGPGSDPFHKDHFHLDLMKLRTGRGKYCH